MIKVAQGCAGCVIRRCAKTDQDCLAFGSAAGPAILHLLLEGSEVAGEGFEGECPELDRVGLGVIGCDLLQPAPADGTKCIT